MIEDRLTHAERIRLEALAQAPHLWAMTSSNAERPELEEILALAVDVETWLQQADNDAPPRFTESDGGQDVPGELAHLELGTNVRHVIRPDSPGAGGVVDAVQYEEGTEVVVTLPTPEGMVAASRGAVLLEAALSLLSLVGASDLGHADVVEPLLLGRVRDRVDGLVEAQLLDVQPPDVHEARGGPDRTVASPVEDAGMGGTDDYRGV